MNDENRGEDILKLLNSFPLKALIGTVQDFYDVAYRERETNLETAIKHCETALEILEELPPENLPDADKLADANGRLHLLLASIYLNQESQLEKAVKHYIQSRDTYHIKAWSHFESLASLGLAITLRKLRSLKEASNACEHAHEIIFSKVDTEVSPEAIKNLHAAIAQERARIQELLEEEKTLPPYEQIPPPGRQQKQFKVFDITIGREIIEKLYKKYTTISVNTLILEDYEQYATPEVVNINLTNLPGDVKEKVKVASYILKVESVNETSGIIDEVGNELQKDHLIFIKEEPSRTKLGQGKKVAVLILTRTMAGIQTCAALKIFIHGPGYDHCVLKGLTPQDQSVIVDAYDTDSKIDIYYQAYVPFVKKFTYDLAISGEVIEVIHRNELL